MRKRGAVLIPALVLALMLAGLPWRGRGAEQGRVILVVLDRVSLAEVVGADTPHLDALAAAGAVGLMTTNTAGSRSQRDAYVTMGAGTRAVGSEASMAGFGTAEMVSGQQAAALYRQRTGWNPPEGALVNLGLPQTLRNNQNKPYPVTIGALGTVLREAGLRTGVFGNCDTDQAYKRYLTSFLMDDRGIVAAGRVDRGLLSADLERPFGIKTNYEALYTEVMEAWNGLDVIGIQLGDTSRTEDFRLSGMDSAYRTHKGLAIEEADAFIGRLMERFDPARDLLLVVTPLGPARELAVNNRLTPFFAIGPGLAPGLAFTASTQRPGVITNLDVGAAVLHFFGLRALPGQLGHAIRTKPAEDPLSALLAMNQRRVEIFNQRSFLLRSYVFAQILAVFLSLAAIIQFRRLLKLGEGLIFFVLSLPVLYLLLPLFHQGVLWGSFLLAWLGAALLAAALLYLPVRMPLRILSICLLTSVLLLLDQWLGGPLIQGSPLGYDVISAARFYGIGNEYMGVLIGASCTACGAFADRFGRMHPRGMLAACAAFTGLVVFTVGYPGLGANVGGTAAAAVAFCAFLLFLRGRRVSWRHLFPAALLVFLLLGAVFLADTLRPAAARSHMGQTAVLIQENGLQELTGIVGRKMSMNLRLIRYTIWTRVFLAFFTAMIVLLYRPIGVLKEVIREYPKTAGALAAAVFGSITALLANDSGIVAAATAMIYAAPPAMLLVMTRLEGMASKGG